MSSNQSNIDLDDVLRRVNDVSARIIAAMATGNLVNWRKVERESAMALSVVRSAIRQAESGGQL